MKYVVGYINFFDNELILEEVSANSPHEAFWAHSKLRSDDWDANKEATKGMDSEELQDWGWDSDMSVSVLELT